MGPQYFMRDHMRIEYFVMLMVFAIPITAILGSLVLRALKILKGNPGAGEGQAPADEVRLLQEIYQGMERLETRVDALETILLSKHGDSKGRGA